MEEILQYFYVDKYGAQQGPHTLGELQELGAITPSTLVWHKGLADWKPASSISELSSIIRPNYYSSTPPPHNSTYTPPQPEGRAMEATIRKPHSWLIESIISLFFSPLTAIIGIIFALRVGTLWDGGNYDEARNASTTAKVMFFIGIGLLILGLITLIVASNIIASNDFNMIIREDIRQIRY